MHTVHKTPAVTVTAKATRDLAADLLLIPVFEDDQLADEIDITRASGGEYGVARSRGEFTGKAFEQLLILIDGDTWKSRRALLVGAGHPKDFTTERLRRIAVIGGLAARQRHLTSMAIVLRSTDAVADGDAVQALTEGAIIANYEGLSYKTAGSPCGWLERVELRVPAGAAEATQSLERGRVLGECTNLARELSNEPGNVLTPREFADRAERMAKEAGLGVEILDEKEIARLGMGLLLGVARGSDQPPRVVVLRHEPKNAVKGVVLGLVGKGITFDTGGISIKPADNMDKMKDDMSGGAAVLCAMAAMSRLNAPVRCIGVIPATENMPGGHAMKPGDILTSAEGKTVEVLNTDAEGRLILGDGAVVRAKAWRDAPGRHRHAHRRVCRRARQDDERAVRQAGLVGRTGAARERTSGRPLVADARVRRLQGSAEERDCGLHQHRRPRGRRDQRRALHQGVRGRSAVGAHGHRRDRVGGGCEAVSAQGRNGRRRAYARRARAQRRVLE